MWSYQMDIDLQYRSFKGLRARCLRLWLQDGWPSFRLAMYHFTILIYIVRCQPIEPHTCLITFLSYSLAHIFHIGIGALQYMHSLFGSFMSLGPKGTFFSLYFPIIASQHFISSHWLCYLSHLLYSIYYLFCFIFFPPRVVIFLSSLHGGQLHHFYYLFHIHRFRDPQFEKVTSLERVYDIFST